MKILWVEDKTDQVVAIMAALKLSGHSILVKRTKEDAIVVLNSGWRGDLVVLDSFLPEESAPPSHSGCELFKEIRSGKWGDWGRQVCVVFVTGYAQLVQNRIASVSPPPAGILGKPLGKKKGIEKMVQAVPALHIEGNSGSIIVNMQIDSVGEVSQHAIVEITDTSLSDTEIQALKALASQWIQVGSSESIEAAQRVLGIVKLQGQGSAQTREVNSFRQWLSTKGDEVKEGLRTAASLVAVGTPAAKLLVKLLGFE